MYDNEDLMTIQELSKYLLIHKMTIYRWIKRNYIPTIHLGGRYRFSKKSIDQWIANKTTTGVVNETV